MTREVIFHGGKKRYDVGQEPEIKTNSITVLHVVIRHKRRASRGKIMAHTDPDI